MLFESQKEREALVSLMLLARFCDKKLSLSEEETFTKIVDKLEWSDVMSTDSFVNENIRNVRDALNSEESLSHFLNQHTAVFSTQPQKEAVLKKVNSVLHADGLDEDEKAMYQRIKSLLTTAS